MKLKELVEKYGEYEIYTDSPNHVVNAFKNLDTTNDGVLCLYAKKPKPKSVWDLEDGDEHAWVDGLGKVKDNYLWRDESSDSMARDVGNIFLTKEEALKDVERRKVETLLVKYGGRRWFKLNDKNWIIDYDCNSNVFRFAYMKRDQRQGCIYFDTYEQAQKAVEEIGYERIKQALFEVR